MNEDDIVVFRDSSKQSEYSLKYTSPFKIERITMKDSFGTGLPKDYWEKFVDLFDARGEVFICGLHSEQIKVV